MTPHDRARPLDAIANQLQVVAGLATELRRSIGADAQKLVGLEGARSTAWSACPRACNPPLRRMCNGDHLPPAGAVLYDL